MAARVDAPAVWQRGFHPLDQEMNLNAITAMIEVLLPRLPGHYHGRGCDEGYGG